MTIDVHEFLNPKSTLTPGILASFVAFSSGAFFVSFHWTMPFCMLLFSFFFALFVFLSREFQEGKLPWYSKAFLYTANAIIVFTLSTGMHAIFDRQASTQQSHISPISFIPLSSALAADDAPAPVRVERPSGEVKQNRPFFADWTENNNIIWYPAAPASAPISLKVERGDVSSWKAALAAWGVLSPDYAFNIHVVGSKTDAPVAIKKVTYSLYSRSGAFDKPQLIYAGTAAPTPLVVKAWSPFLVVADVELGTGEKLKVDTFVTPASSPAH